MATNSIQRPDAERTAGSLHRGSCADKLTAKQRKASFAAPPGSPALPNGLTRFEVIEGLRELRNDAVAAEKLKDPSFVRWPDLDAILDHIEHHGLPAPENAPHEQRGENNPKV